MILIVGLGNPGEKYKETRHNVGFMTVDALATDLGIGFKEDKKRGVQVAEYTMTFPGQRKKVRMAIIKPQTFMNNSGEAVSKVRKYYQIPEENIWVIHDDLDIEIGSIRIRKGGSSAGQKGVQSIIDQLGYNEFIRFRIGIKPVDGQNGSAESFVLKKFSKEEQKTIKREIGELIETIKIACDCGVENTTF